MAVLKMLRRAGFTAIEARDGSAAMEVIRGHKSHIDVLFLDVTLPGIPSRDVLEEARRLRPGMNLVVTSAYSRDSAEETLRGKVEHFLRKPYQVSDLINLVRQTLP
jgi:DNA-binding NtrC family response regulator